MFTFPNPVNETSARLVAGGVVVLTLAFAFTQHPVILAFIVWGFWARVLTGPTLSPLGQLATRVVQPFLARRSSRFDGPLVPGPPKRFAQGIGTALSSVALLAYLGGATGVSVVIVLMITVAATLESVAGYCLGCAIFAQLMARGIIPEDTCEACNNLNLAR